MRVGFDLVQISQVRDSILHFGDRYVNRIYTPGEIAVARDQPDQLATRLASRFAAKEATLKVLRPNARWLDWRLIEVVRTAGGWPEILLHGEASLLAKAAGLGELSVTMSHEADYAGAVVIAADPVASTKEQRSGTRGGRQKRTRR